jgi:hypothetical protein
VNVHACKKWKFGPKTMVCIFLGYAQHSAVYKFLIIKSEIPDVHANTMIESRDATFFKNIFPVKDSVASSSQPTYISASEPSNNSEPTNDIEQVTEQDIDAPRRSKRQRIETFFGDDFIIYLVDDLPKTLSKAFASLDAQYCKEAVQNEMNSILTNGTWEICDCPVGCKPVGCKWIFKKKLKPDGTIDKYKARLVAKGFTQK